MSVRVLLLLLVCSTTTASLLAQVTISDSVVHAERVLRIEPNNCRPIIEVRTSRGFSIGDRILIHQVRGATCSQDSPYDDGSLTSIENAGRFEFNWIEDIRGNVITLRERLTVAFFVESDVQIVKVIYAPSLRITGKITTRPWDNACGGVIAIEADTDIELIRAQINASGAGFIGGDMSRDNYTCTPGTDMFDVAPSTKYGAKGQGVAKAAMQNTAGRARIANGGGGGGNHNSGGGGGGNTSKGGNGGKNWGGCPTYETDGLGGSAIQQQPSDPRLIFGGGGGGGHQDEARLGSRGGNGGGVVIISCKTLHSSAAYITADGEAVSDIAQHNGAAGGGGGGTILVDATTINGYAQLKAMGGNGGDVDGSDPKPCGPGGGGGGGCVMYTADLPSSSYYNDVSRGLHGQNIGKSDEAQRTWYSADGSDGAVMQRVAMPKRSSGTSGVLTLLGQIDLGTHPAGSSFDTTMYIANLTASPIRVTSVTARYGRIQISSLTPDIPYMLAPGSSIKVSYRVTVTQGEEFDEILVNTDDCDSSIAARRTWRSLTDTTSNCQVVVKLITSPQAVGDLATIDVVISKRMTIAPPKAFSLALEAKHDVLDLRRSRVIGATHDSSTTTGEFTRIHLSGVWTGNDTLCHLDVLTLLDHEDSTTVRFSSEYPLTWDGPCYSMTSDATFMALDVCATRRLRSIKLGPVPTVNVLSNSEGVTIQRRDASNDAIYIRASDVRGSLVTDAVMFSNETEIRISPGWYLVSLSSGTWSMTTPVMVR